MPVEQRSFSDLRRDRSRKRRSHTRQAKLDSVRSTHLGLPPTPSRLSPHSSYSSDKTLVSSTESSPVKANPFLSPESYRPSGPRPPPPPRPNRPHDPPDLTPLPEDSRRTLIQRMVDASSTRGPRTLKPLRHYGSISRRSSARRAHPPTTREARSKLSKPIPTTSMSAMNEARLTALQNPSRRAPVPPSANPSHPTSTASHPKEEAKEKRGHRVPPPLPIAPAPPLSCSANHALFTSTTSSSVSSSSSSSSSSTLTRASTIAVIPPTPHATTRSSPISSGMFPAKRVEGLIPRQGLPRKSSSPDLRSLAVGSFSSMAASFRRGRNQSISHISAPWIPGQERPSTTEPPEGKGKKDRVRHGRSKSVSFREDVEEIVLPSPSSVEFFLPPLPPQGARPNPSRSALASGGVKILNAPSIPSSSERVVGKAVVMAPGKRKSSLPSKATKKGLSELTIVPIVPPLALNGSQDEGSLIKSQDDKKEGGRLSPTLAMVSPSPTRPFLPNIPPLGDLDKSLLGTSSGSPWNRSIIKDDDDDEEDGGYMDDLDGLIDTYAMGGEEEEEEEEEAAEKEKDSDEDSFKSSLLRSMDALSTLGDLSLSLSSSSTRSGQESGLNQVGKNLPAISAKVYGDSPELTRDIPLPPHRPSTAPPKPSLVAIDPVGVSRSGLPMANNMPPTSPDHAMVLDSPVKRPEEANGRRFLRRKMSDAIRSVYDNFGNSPTSPPLSFPSGGEARPRAGSSSSNGSSNGSNGGKGEMIIESPLPSRKSMAQPVPPGSYRKSQYGSLSTSALVPPPSTIPLPPAPSTMTSGWVPRRAPLPPTAPFPSEASVPPRSQTSLASSLGQPGRKAPVPPISTAHHYRKASYDVSSMETVRRPVMAAPTGLVGAMMAGRRPSTGVVDSSSSSSYHQSPSSVSSHSKDVWL